MTNAIHSGNKTFPAHPGRQKPEYETQLQR